MKPKKVIILGSGALKIGEAGEFDYSTSQCLKALKEDSIQTVLVNPNIATYQTSAGMADRIYFLPITVDFVEGVIKKEKPDAIMLSFGGQTALNCGLELERKGILDKYGVSVLGTPIKAIELTEDRHLFAKELQSINVFVPKSKAAHHAHDALAIAEEIGYPVMIRVAFALGGKGSGVAHTKQELQRMVDEALTSSPQILVEEYLGGWKEIEYEVVRDAKDNCITVCNMENFDPLGIHTGESIVVAPSQTLSNSEYHLLRETSIKVIRHFGIVGECNIQFALDPRSEEYRVIEVNARLSRSSALASKATGYPLAYIAAKLGLGYSLPELQNSITKSTCACFEPALDYLVIKIPRWDLHKFKQVSKKIGSEMKSVGEVMSIGRTFEEALQKGLRMLGMGYKGLTGNDVELGDLAKELKEPTDERIFAVVEGMQQGMSVAEINKLTGIDPWFLERIRMILVVEAEIRKEYQHAGKLSAPTLLKAKQYGFSDYHLGRLVAKTELEVRELRKHYGILPSIKQIDTLAAEYPAQTNYLYLTYHGCTQGCHHDVAPLEQKNKSDKSMLVLGSGSYRIGSSVEFDWCSVHCALALQKAGYKTIMLNYNPETVSTDYDTSDKLYFEELSFERVLDIYELEQPEGLVVSMGGQIPNNLALRCHKAGLHIIGTSPVDIDSAEDRYKFSKLLDELSIDQPLWKELSTTEEAIKFARKANYPVLIRPSYVLSGSAMNVVFHDEELALYLEKAAKVSAEHPVVVSKFEVNSKELEIDAVGDHGKVVAWAISEHIENAGVHSGDATMVLPPQHTYLETLRRVKHITEKIAAALSITGPFNIQFLAKDNHVKVIECNLRASRSFPFVSKVLKQNFIELATLCMIGKGKKIALSNLDLDYVGVKAPQFSYSRLKGADPLLSVEMASTGEVGCLGKDLHEAFLKAVLATGLTWPKKGILLSVSGDENRYKLLDHIRKLADLGFKLYGTEHTAEFYSSHGIQIKMLHKVHEKTEPNTLTYLLHGKIDLVISMPKEYASVDSGGTKIVRRAAVDCNVPLINNIQLAKVFIDAIADKKMDDLEIKAWEEY
ncbi:carbamoyl-phosphate synthase (glutamine-hydrolyzing) large subunit [Candidatus Woesearchaeota archaeon]|nr:carbamoyl-phosphate synthase (glutamine-hydrolyzing) large subunit [Candidatus Woesearchaeota archaeon]